MDDKVIVTNRSALMKKYGRQGTAKIRQAMRVLSAADKKRGMKNRVVYLDDANTMKKLGGKPVLNATDPRENKQAIDAVFTALLPDYLMILGSPDVVPHQDLDNPVYDPTDGDDDTQAWGDVPYACEAPYSRDPARFVGPTRVVGRVPDLVSAAEPSYLIALLKTAATAQRREPDTYAGYFGLSAEEWRGSTRLSLNNIFGQATDLLLTPPAGPDKTHTRLENRMHFINCHGGPASPEFLGQRGRATPRRSRPRRPKERLWMERWQPWSVAMGRNCMMQRRWGSICRSVRATCAKGPTGIWVAPRSPMVRRTPMGRPI